MSKLIQISYESAMVLALLMPAKSYLTPEAQRAVDELQTAAVNAYHEANPPEKEEDLGLEVFRIP
jgi:hypothetical protein